MPQLPVDTNDRVSMRIATEENERLKLTDRDSLIMLDLLDNPPEPNSKLMAAAYAMPKRK